MPLSVNERLQLILVYSKPGQTTRSVATLFNVTHSTVSRIVRNYNATGRVTRKKGSGRRRKTTAGDDHHLMVTAKRNPGIPVKRLIESSGLEISDTTGRRILKVFCDFGSKKKLISVREYAATSYGDSQSSQIPKSSRGITMRDKTCICRSNTGEISNSATKNCSRRYMRLKNSPGQPQNRPTETRQWLGANKQSWSRLLFPLLGPETSLEFVGI